MDFSLTEEQELLRRSAREFLDKECPKDFVRQMEQDERGYTRELWEKVCELGWAGIMVPEEYGGMGGSFLDLVILLEEMGRALLPGPYFASAVLGSLPLLLFGTKEQKERYLPELASGEKIFSLALLEPEPKYDPSGIALKAEERGDKLVLSGTKLFVPYGHAADYVITAVRLREAPLTEGLGLVLVEAQTPGLSIAPLPVISGEKQSEVVFDKAEVPKENLLGGELDWGRFEELILRGAVAASAYIVGGLQFILDTTVEYAKTRVQFGRPIGTFQVIQHRLADMLAEVEGARFVTYQAAWRISENLPYRMEAAIAKAWVSECFYRTCVQAIQTHGAIGCTYDHDLSLFYRRAKAAACFLGDADFHREIVAQEMGL